MVRALGRDGQNIVQLPPAMPMLFPDEKEVPELTWPIVEASFQANVLAPKTSPGRPQSTPETYPIPTRAPIKPQPGALLG
jgi:hypothetical protein